MRRVVTLLALVLGLNLLCAVPALAQGGPPAQNPFDNPNNPERVCQKPNAAASPVCQPQTGNPISGPDGILMKASRIVAYVGGVAATIIIIVGGFMMVTAGGDSSKVSKGRTAVIGAAVGLIIIVLAQAIITFVINRVL